MKRLPLENKKAIKKRQYIFPNKEDTTYFSAIKPNDYR